MYVVYSKEWLPCSPKSAGDVRERLEQHTGARVVWTLWCSRGRPKGRPGKRAVTTIAIDDCSLLGVDAPCNFSFHIHHSI